MSSRWLMVCVMVGCSGTTTLPGSGGGGGATPEAGPSTESGAGTRLGAGGISGPIDTITMPGVDAGMADPNACGEHHFNLVRKPAEVLLVLDRSKSMLNPPKGASGTSKWDLIRPPISQVITDTDTAVSWGMKSFPEGVGSECIASSVTNKIDVPVAAKNAANVTAAVKATTALGNGTPTGDAIKQVVAYLRSIPDDNPKYILLATDGDPSCPMSGDAHAFAVQAIADAAAAGINTFVVGIATGKSSAATLNEMALAGKEPRQDPNPAADKFYFADTDAALTTALKVITGQVSNCIFSWNDPPPVPSNIAVKIGGTKAPQDPGNGWQYTGTDYKGVQVFGSACDAIKSTAANQVEVIFGCPSSPIQ